MRDMNQTLNELDLALSRILRGKLQRIRLTEAVFVNPNLQWSEVRLVPIFRRPEELKALILISYFVDDEALGIFLREQVREQVRNFSLDQRLQLEVLLCGNKSTVLRYFELTEEYSMRSFFGNLVPLGIKCFNQLHFSRRKLRPPTRPVWRRGYKDKGSRRPLSSWLPSFDYSFTEAQNEKERIDSIYQQYLKQVLETLKQLE